MKSEERTRESLFEMAKAIFARKGLEGTTVREIADKAGVNVAMISYHFGSKEGLFRSCLEQFGKSRLAAAERVLQPAKSAEEFRVRFEMFVTEIIDSYVQEPELTTLVQRECESLAHRSDELFRHTFLRIFETFHEFFKAAQRSGFLRKDLDPFVVTAHIFAMVGQMSRMDSISQNYFGLTVKDARHRRKMIDGLVQLALSGVLVEEA